MSHPRCSTFHCLNRAPAKFVSACGRRGLNGFDRSVASGMVRAMFEYQFPVILGRDGPGVGGGRGGGGGGR
jgi:hypothetical protein